MILIPLFQFLNVGSVFPIPSNAPNAQRTENISPIHSLKVRFRKHMIRFSLLKNVG